jgi:hypothetical protein
VTVVGANGVEIVWSAAPPSDQLTKSYVTPSTSTLAGAETGRSSPATASTV